MPCGEVVKLVDGWSAIRIQRNSNQFSSGHREKEKSLIFHKKFHKITKQKVLSTECYEIHSMNSVSD